MANQTKNLARLAALTATVVLTGLVAIAQTSAVRLVTQKVDESKLTTLPGHVHPAANALNDRGPVDESAPVGHIVLLLKRSDAQQIDLDAFVDQLHNPKSENYHKWLTPESFGSRFGPADEDVAAVVSWLESKGFTIEDVPASKTHITFTGNVGQMRDAFHIDVHHLMVNGVAHQAAMNEPQIPSALASVVSGFQQLHDFGPRPANHFAGVFKKDPATGKMTPAGEGSTAPRADFTNTYNSETFYEVGPQDFYTIYNETPLLTAGINGAGVTIAVIEQSQINPADPVSFRSQFGLPAYPATPTPAAGGINFIYGGTPAVGSDAACTAPLTVAAGKASGDEGEADIDVQWAGTAAPKATIDFVACGTKANAIGSFGTDLAAEHIANYLAGSVTAASLSYTLCEVDSGNTAFYANLWEQFAAQGQTAVVAAGDGGSMGCETLTNNPSVNVMAATAFNISAGGTDFGDAYVSNDYTTSPASTWWSASNGAGLSSAKSYMPETTWGGYCSNALFVSFLQETGSAFFGSTYTPEAVCNNSNSISGGYTAVVGGGGGPSANRAIPSWQSVWGIGQYSSSNTKRNQPDISLFAGNGFWGHALPFCESDVYTCDFATSPSDAYNLQAGGTSFPAPQISGIIALINQATGQAQGQADYTLYALAAQEYGTAATPNNSNLTACSGSALGASVGANCIFRDIAADTPSLQGGSIASQIIEPCNFAKVNNCYRSNNADTYGLSAITTSVHSSTLAYPAGAGYDLATGLGSINIANLVNNWNSLSSGFATTTVLAVSASPVAYSLSPTETLTATVTATGRGATVAPGGKAQFFSGGSTSGPLLGTASLVPVCTGGGASTSCKGVATLALAPSAPLAPGANSIVAYFEGDGANDAPSTSAAKGLTINTWPQTVTITSPNTGTYGVTLPIKATASSGLAAFTFSVISGPATVTGGGLLTFTGVGAVVVKVNQAGNGTYAPAFAQQTITVSPATPTMTVSSSLSPSTYGQSITFTATMSSGPTGTVTFYDGGNPIGTGTLSGYAIATYATAALTAGTHSITASWTSSNPDYNSVTSSNTFSQVVNQLVPVISWNVPAAIVYGTALSATQLNATCPVPGTFVYTPALGAVLTTGSKTLSVTFTPTDTTNYSTATKTVTLIVNKAAPVIAWAAPAAIVYGTPLSGTQLNATVNWVVGGVNIAVPGIFTYTPPAGTVLGAATQTLSVTFAPTDTTDYATPAMKTVSLTVNKATPTITWPTPAPVTWNTVLGPAQLDAAATWTVGVTTGSVAGAYVYLPPAGTVMANIGQTTLKVTFTPTDSVDYLVATATVQLTVTQVAPVVTWATPAPITYGTALSGVQLDATANGPGTFVYTPAAGTVLGAGLQTLSVTFTPTDSVHYSPVTKTVQLQVNQFVSVISWATPAPIFYGNALGPAQLNATANVPGTFIYTPAAGAFEPVGTNTLTVSFIPTDIVDYTTPGPATVSLVVNPAIPAVLTAPLPAGGATLPPGPTTVTWTAGSGPAAYQIVVGTGSPGWDDVYWSGIITSTSTSVTIPNNGVDLWIRFWQSIAGVWSYTDYAYTESGTLIPASMQSPTPGSSISGSVTFDWSGGAGPAFYQLLVGTQGVGMADLYSSGATHATSATVNIPADGVTVYVRLMQLINGAWESTDYTYTQTGSVVLAAITSPSPGSVLPGSTVTFQWPGGVGPSQYQLVVGTIGVGSGDLYIASPSAATQATLNNIPTDGATVFVRLNQRVNGVFQSTDYTYTAAGTLVPAQITSPTPGSTLPGASVTFSWPGASGPSQYQLLVGTTYAGSNNVYYSGVVATTSETVTVPTNGVKLYVRLLQRINGAWQTTDYTYTEFGSPTPPALQTPTTGTLLSGPTTFTWSAGAGPSSYQLAVGTTGVGSANLYYLAPTSATSSASVTIPANGVKVFVRLSYLVSGVWSTIDYTYTEAGTTIPAAITSPPPGSTLTGSSVTFSWPGGAGPAAYQLAVGTGYAGSANVYYSGTTQATSETVTVPTTGATLYVRLYQMINGVFQSTDYTYTEQ